MAKPTFRTTYKTKAAHFYSRKYYWLKGIPYFGRYDPFTGKGDEAPPELIEKNELFEDETPFYTWDISEKILASKYLPAALESLTRMQRQVFLMKYVEGKYVNQIARELGICRSAAHRRLQRARQRLKIFLEKIEKNA